MQGEINVEHIMERANRRREWQRRQRCDAEWYALKQWWRAEARVRRAGGVDARRRAERARAKTALLYRAELRRVWPKWQRAQQERWRAGMASTGLIRLDR